MLKTMGMHKLVAPAIALMLGIGVVLTGIGFAMERNTEYLKEDGNHKWYQIVYIDQNGWFRFGVTFGDLVSFGGFRISDAPDAPEVPQAPSAPVAP